MEDDLRLDLRPAAMEDNSPSYDKSEDEQKLYEAEDAVVTGLPDTFADAPSKPEDGIFFVFHGEGGFCDEQEKRKYELYVEDFTKSQGFDMEHFYNKVAGALTPTLSG